MGNLGNALDFVNIGILGNCSDIAKIANDFERGNKRGGRGGRKALSYWQYWQNCHAPQVSIAPLR